MKKGFSATEFLKRSIELEEQQTEEKPDLDQVPQAGTELSSDTKQELIKEEVPPKIDNLKIDKDFYKVPNVVDDLITPTLSAIEEVIYRRLIRMSWGWGKNYCRASIKLFQETSGIKSRTTIKAAINKLLDSKIVYRYVDINGRADRNQNGTVYIVPIPNVSKSSILKNGTPARSSDTKR
ncbi:MAG: hypothetical protein J7L19_03255 [Dehalococcoidia bacterium]|nr:hypothetical protein [Dehalococcoidia bacterium]